MSEEANPVYSTDPTPAPVGGDPVEAGQSPPVTALPTVEPTVDSTPVEINPRQKPPPEDA